jgi:2-succinyl-6-hydroxy-2,4-cyclohexadiene-1-carboxylate synthase
MADSQILQLASVALAYESWGTGEALVFVHGFGTDREVLRGLAETLGRGRRVVLLDLRGHGASGSPSEAADEQAYGYPTQCGDLIALMDALELDRVHWVGHSMGGQLALMAALSAPERTRSLTVIGAGSNRPVTEEREVRAWTRAADRFEAMAKEELASALAAAAPRVAPQPGDDRVLYANARGTELARIVRGAFLTMRDNSEACRVFEAPALVIAGQEDAQWLEPARKLATLLPRADFHELPGAGHLAQLEQPDVVVGLIADFLLQQAV